MEKLKKLNDEKFSKNRLSGETSPYLLSHADNPVEWRPWNEDAFSEAKILQKPVFLSVGYSTCHWCHVMAEESFEDLNVAEILNADFIPIKVDREERPDIDAVYMKYCQAMTGQGGWPLNMILTPDKKPYFAATYLPKTGHNGMKGIIEILNEASYVWNNRKDDVISSSVKISDLLAAAPGKKTEISKKRDYEKGRLFKEAIYSMEASFDSINGGFGSAPKFPLVQNILFLLGYGHFYNRNSALEMAEKTLLAIRDGGIYDQIGFGVHRYSTDKEWKVPHFEKMLYDQALMAYACSECFLITKNPVYLSIAEEIAVYCIRVLLSDKGGFFSAEDADTSGIEGKYYLWTTGELKELLSQEEYNSALKFWNIKEDGNISDPFGHMPGKANVLYRSGRERPYSNSTISRDYEKVRNKIFETRELREKPLTDRKILCDSNGLMIAALAKLYFGGEDKKYLNLAESTLKFIIEEMTNEDFHLSHSWSAGFSSGHGFLQDYSYLIWGITELYEACLKPEYLEYACKIAVNMIDRFYSKRYSAFSGYSDEDESLPLEIIESYDSAVPSGNSSAVFALYRLYRLTGIDKFREYADKVWLNFSEEVISSPVSHGFFLSAIKLIKTDGPDIVITGDDKFTGKIMDIIRWTYPPDAEWTYASEFLGDNSGLSLDLNEKFSNYRQHENAVHVCYKKRCIKPARTPEEFSKILSEYQDEIHEKH